MDAERLRTIGEANASRGDDRTLGHNMIPAWVDDWCRTGDRARSHEQKLVKFDRKALFEAEVKDASAPTFEKGKDGKMRRPRATVAYVESEDDDDASSDSDQVSFDWSFLVFLQLLML
jgi:hypothetical protein